MSSAVLKVKPRLEITKSLIIRGEESEEPAVSQRIEPSSPDLHAESWWLPGSRSSVVEQWQLKLGTLGLSLGHCRLLNFLYFALKHVLTVWHSMSGGLWCVCACV